MLVLELKGKLESGDLLTFGFKLQTLLISFCNAATLQFVFHLHILFVNFALFRQNFKNLAICHVALTFQVFDPGVSDRDVDINLGVFCEESTCLGLLTF